MNIINVADFQLKTFDFTKENELFLFAKTHPWEPVWSQEYIAEFIQNLTSDPSLIFDCFDGHLRIAVAVLIDKIQNKGNNACLEFLGLDKNYNINLVYDFIIRTAKTRLPQSRSGIEITLGDLTKTIKNILIQEGFEPYYETYEMVCNLKNHEVLAFKNKVFNDVTKLGKQDYLACYELIVKSFEHNPDICIPSYEDWLLTRTSEQSLSFIYKINNKVAGFLSLTDHAHSEYGEIRTLGVLPHYRGQGIGKKLLLYGLNYFACKNYQSCYLTVATQNKNALSIYQNIGFSIDRHFEVYCWKVD